MQLRTLTGLWLVSGAVAASACTGILGDYTFVGTTGGGGAGGGRSTADAGDAGDAGCTPGTKSACYTGPAGTAKNGACHAGKATCLDDGSYGPCEEEVTPLAQDDCDGLRDTTCDGKTDCACTPNATTDCYDGKSGTQDAGTCKAGKKTCNTEGTSYGPCNGEVVPEPLDLCDGNKLDENCDGVVDDLCTCVPNKQSDCYTGAPGTAGVGACQSGKWTCNEKGTGYTTACAGDVTPKTTDDCSAGNTVDEDCTGSYCTETVWARAFGTAGSQSFTSVAFDGDGNVIVGGGFNASIGIGSKVISNNGDYDGLVVKFDAKGNYLWAQGFGDNWYQYVWDVATDSSNNVYIIGEFKGTIDLGAPTTAISTPGEGPTFLFAAKFAADGTPQWLTTVTSLNELYSIYSRPKIAVQGSRVLVAGSFAGTLKIGSTTITGDGGFVSALSAANGTALWATGVQQDQDAAYAAIRVNALAVDNGQGAYIAGSVDRAATITAGTNSYFGWTTTIQAAGGFWFRVDSTTGNTTGSSGSSLPKTPCKALAVDPLGSVFVASEDTSSSTLPLILAKYSNAGDGYRQTWASPFGNNVTANSLTVTSDGNVLVGGFYSGAADFGGGVLSSPTNPYKNIFLLKVDQDMGTHLWSRGYDGRPSDFYYNGVKVAATTGGFVSMAASVASTPTVGWSLTPNSSASMSAVIAKIADK